MTVQILNFKKRCSLQPEGRHNNRHNRILESDKLSLIIASKLEDAWKSFPEHLHAKSSSLQESLLESTVEKTFQFFIKFFSCRNFALSSRNSLF